MDSKNFVPVSGLNDLSESALLTGEFIAAGYAERFNYEIYQRGL
jgi:hypothetical protein